MTTISDHTHASGQCVIPRTAIGLRDILSRDGESPTG